MPNLIFARYEKGPKISKIGHVTPSRPANGGLPVTRYLDSLTPICLFAMQHSFGLRCRLRVVYRWASPLLRLFLANFWPKIWLGHVTC